MHQYLPGSMASPSPTRSLLVFGLKLAVATAPLFRIASMAVFDVRQPGGAGVLGGGSGLGRQHLRLSCAAA